MRLFRTDTDALRATRAAIAAGFAAVMTSLALTLPVFAPFFSGDAGNCAYANEAHSVPLLAIVAEFDGGGEANAVPYNESYDWGFALFEAQDSLRQYYLDLSGGRVSFEPANETCAYGSDGAGARNRNQADRAGDGIVHVTLNRAYHAWGLVNDDPQVSADFAEAMLAAFEAASTYIDYGAYDVNGDGIIDPDELCVVFYVPGYDASTLVDPGRSDLPVMWPHSGKITLRDDIPDDIDGFVLDSYIALTENLWTEGTDLSSAQQEPVGILCHEIGHFFGLPDLYPLNANPTSQAWGAYRVESLSLMDSGGWAALDASGNASGRRYVPTALDGWCRYLLGWNMPDIVTESGDYLVSSQNSQQGYRSLLIPTSDPDQYYLVENREPEGRDAAFATRYAQASTRGGIVIWFIDKRMHREHYEENALNDTDHHPGCMPVFLRAGGGAVESGNWAQYEPNLDAPFFSQVSALANTGNGDTVFELPLYPSGADDEPADRIGSRVYVRFPDEPARNMTVHIELPSSQAGECASALTRAPAPDESSAASLGCESPLGHAACVALLAETQADIALVDVAGIARDLDAGPLSFADVYSVLPRSSTIQLFEATGQQILDFLENELDAHAQKAPELGQSVFFEGVGFTADWSKPAGNRVGSATIGAQVLRPQKTYRVATTASLAESYGLAASWRCNTLVLFGSPADALRSLVQHADWQDRVAETIVERTYINAGALLAPSPEPAPDADDDAANTAPDLRESLLTSPAFTAVMAGVLAAALVAAFFLIRSARRS